MSKKLTIKQETFAVEYARTRSGTQSYRAAYDAENMTPESVNTAAQNLLTHPVVSLRIEELIDQATKINNFKVGDVLSHWVDIATADPNDIVQIRRVCCRHCHGWDFKPQPIDDAEFAAAIAEAVRAEQPMPVRYNPTLDPNADCPFCYGEGLEYVFVLDSRKLKGAARRLYRGVKKTKYGTEVFLRDQDDALRNIAKFLGMFKDRLELSGKDGTPLPLISAVTTDPVEAAKIYQKIMSENLT